MTHTELHAHLDNLGWKRDEREDGTVFRYLKVGPVDRAIQTITDDPEHARCMTRGGESAVVSVDDAAGWASEAMPR